MRLITVPYHLKKNLFDGEQVAVLSLVSHWLLTMKSRVQSLVISGFVVDKVTSGQVLLRLRESFPVTYHSTSACVSSIIQGWNNGLTCGLSTKRTHVAPKA
jgi:hypothetical protein